MMDSHCRAGVTVGIQGGGGGRPQPLGRAGAAGGGRICREVRLQDSEPGGRELASVPPRVRLAPPRNLGAGGRARLPPGSAVVRRAGFGDGGSRLLRLLPPSCKFLHFSQRALSHWMR